jgi:hypothetical protein
LTGAGLSIGGGLGAASIADLRSPVGLKIRHSQSVKKLQSQSNKIFITKHNNLKIPRNLSIEYNLRK